MVSMKVRQEHGVKAGELDPNLIEPDGAAASSVENQKLAVSLDQY
mgnify:CR=1 FL=1